jgi:protein-S-isoprenylcysteine O-methyltransferase Ste14
MSRTGRIATLIYGISCYSIFFGSFLYLIGWVTNRFVPTSISSAGAVDTASALGIDLLLIAVFGLQHSVMARPGFKERLTRAVPQPAERATYVLASSAALWLLFAFWQPIPAALWRAEGALAAALEAGALLGFSVVLVTTFLIDHFDLFGLRQIFLAWRGVTYTEKHFVTPGPYRWIRHPLYVGWMLAFWSTPLLTAGHLLFALGMTGYILVAIRFEERDLETALGEPYRRWRNATPMFVPRTRPSERTARAVIETA